MHETGHDPKLEETRKPRILTEVHWDEVFTNDPHPDLKMTDKIEDVTCKMCKNFLRIKGKLDGIEDDKFRGDVEM